MNRAVQWRTNWDFNSSKKLPHRRCFLVVHEPIHNPVTIAEIAVEKGATALLVPVACRRQLFDLSDDMATKIDIQFYSDARDALLKAMVE